MDTDGTPGTPSPAKGPMGPNSNRPSPNGTPAATRPYAVVVVKKRPIVIRDADERIPERDEAVDAENGEKEPAEDRESTKDSKNAVDASVAANRGKDSSEGDDATQRKADEEEKSEEDATTRGEADAEAKPAAKDDDGIENGDSKGAEPSKGVEGEEGDELAVRGSKETHSLIDDGKTKTPDAQESAGDEEETTKAPSDVEMTDETTSGANAKNCAADAGDEQPEPSDDAEILKETVAKENEIEEDGQNDPEAAPEPENALDVGSTVEKYVCTESAQMELWNGRIVDRTGSVGRVPELWEVYWQGETQNEVVLGEEWTKEDLEGARHEDAPFVWQNNWKFATENVHIRSQEAVFAALQTSDLLPSLMIVAMLEETLQVSLQKMQTENNNNASTKGSTVETPHPPLFYHTNPTSYLRTPSIDESGRNKNESTVTSTTQSLTQRVKSGCQLAWNFLSAQHPKEERNSKRTNRRQSRASTSGAAPAAALPVPVQRGGRVALWLLDRIREEAAVVSTGPSNYNEETSDKPDESKSGSGGDENAMDTGDDAPIGDDGEGEVPANSNSESPDDAPGAKDVEGDLDEQPVEFNEYWKPSTLNFLELLARPKSLTTAETKEAICQCLVFNKFNRRQVTFGLPSSMLDSLDKIALESEFHDLREGTIALKSGSGETLYEMKRLDLQSFSRCKLALDIVETDPNSRLNQQQMELNALESRFKEQKSWDKYRFKGIHEGFAMWPNWDTAVMKHLGDAFASADEDQPTADNNDAALAETISALETTGRRRTARRGAAAAASEGVFYGSQSQLTHKQLMDAIVRLVKANKFQTFAKLMTLIADGSTDPTRRARVALGRLVWKLNKMNRRVVNADWSDGTLLEHLSGAPLVTELQLIGVDDQPNGGEEPDENTKNERNDLIKYLSGLHETEMRLRSIALKYITDIPVPIIATAGDERSGSMDAMDINEFADISQIRWYKKGHPFLGKVIYRPYQMEHTNADSPCQWFKIADYSRSEALSETEDDPSGDRDATEVAIRMRFRAFPSFSDGSMTGSDQFLLLTEAQVSAGEKAGEMMLQQSPENDTNSSAFEQRNGSKILLIPTDESSDHNDMLCVVIGHEKPWTTDESATSHHLLLMPETENESAESFWVTLDEATNSSRLTCKTEEGVEFKIEQFDFHSSSPAHLQCKAVLEYAQNHPKAGPFMEPVDPIALGVPKYFEVVKHPMDLSTVEKKLEDGEYAKFSQSSPVGRDPIATMLNGSFRSDINLVFDNAILFNPPDDWIHQGAVVLKKAVAKKIDSICRDAYIEQNTGRRSARKSVYVDENSDVDMYEYESDHDDYAESGGRRKGGKKRARSSAGSAGKEDYSPRAIEQVVRIQGADRDSSSGLQGSMSNFPINTDASSFALRREWSLKVPSDDDSTDEPDAPQSEDTDSGEVSKLVDMQREADEIGNASLRRSTRASQPSPVKRKLTNNNQKNKKSEGDSTKVTKFVLPKIKSAPTSNGFNDRVDVEIHLEKLHENHFAKLYHKHSDFLISGGGDIFPDSKEAETLGLYSADSFPPYLGRVLPGANAYRGVWEIRQPFAVAALRWVIRGLIHSGHLSTPEETLPLAPVAVLANNAYYCDKNIRPFEVLNPRNLQRKQRQATAAEEESDSDVEMSEYERLRAERVARNAERLKALGFA